MNADVILDAPLSGRKIGFFGKGGAGKSTMVVLLAHTLQQRGYTVTVLDADSTNYGLHAALGLASPPEALLDWFGGAVFQGGAVTCPVDDPARIGAASLTWREIPDRFKARSSDGIRFLVAGKIADRGVGAGCDGPVAKIARDLALTPEITPGVLLVDFKAGFEDSARGVVTGIDWGVVVVDPTAASIRLALDMHRLLDDLRAARPPATAHLDRPEAAALMREIFRNAAIRGLSVVLNRVDGPEARRVLRQELEAHGVMPEAVLTSEPGISTAWLRGTPLGVSSGAASATRSLAERLECAFSLQRVI